MILQQRREGPITILDLAKTIVGGPDFELIERTVGGLLSADRRLVVFNLSDAHYINSTGIGSLIWAWKRMKDHGGTVVLAEPSPYVRRVFDLFKGMENYLRVFENETDAVRFLSNPMRRQWGFPTATNAPQ